MFPFQFSLCITLKSCPRKQFIFLKGTDVPMTGSNITSTCLGSRHFVLVGKGEMYAPTRKHYLMENGKPYIQLVEPSLAQLQESAQQTILVNNSWVCPLPLNQEACVSFLVTVIVGIEPAGKGNISL
jgi:hypothetical protein